ncbi:MAG: hypothetical protein GY941_30065 [Planctomycetes bacterium]|nr:hypothetical protein [Planctomycetota bacterium]
MEDLTGKIHPESSKWEVPNPDELEFKDTYEIPDNRFGDDGNGSWRLSR